MNSRLNEGSTFTVVLPRRSSASANLRVQLISADDELAPFVVHLLRSEGYGVRRDRDIARARNRLAVEGARCIIVDCEGESGDLAAFYREAQDVGAAPAFLAIGGAEGAHVPWIAMLPKPFLSADLLSALERVRLSFSEASA